MSQIFTKIRNATLLSAEIPQYIGELRALTFLCLAIKSAFAILYAACMSQDGFYKHDSTTVTILEIFLTLINFTIRESQKLWLQRVLLSAFLCSSELFILMEDEAALLHFIMHKERGSVCTVSMFMFILNMLVKESSTVIPPLQLQLVFLGKPQYSLS